MNMDAYKDFRDTDWRIFFVRWIKKESKNKEKE